MSCRRSGRGIGSHGAEHALEDDRPLQLERQARGCWLASQHRGHTGALQADHCMDHRFWHLQGSRPMSGLQCSELPLATHPFPAPTCPSSKRACSARRGARKSRARRWRARVSLNHTGTPAPRAALRAPRVSSTPRRPVAIATGTGSKILGG